MYISQYVDRVSFNGRLNRQRRRVTGIQPSTVRFYQYTVVEYVTKSVDGIVFSLFFINKKRITRKIELIQMCARIRKTSSFDPFSVFLQKHISL